MGEQESELFQFTFNGFLKVAFQGSRVTSGAGLMLVRELDERLGLEAILTEHLRDSRHGLNTQFPLPDLLRQSVYSRLAGWPARCFVPAGMRVYITVDTGDLDSEGCGIARR